jgi:hypothetical protein
MEACDWKIDHRLSLRQPLLRKRWKGERLCAVKDSGLNVSLAFDDCRIDFEGFLDLLIR